MQVLIDLALPIGVFVVSLAVLLWLRRLALDQVERWARVKSWPADTIFFQNIKLPSIILCLVISIYVGVAISPISGDWKGPLGNSLLTFFILASMVAFLRIIQGLTTFFGSRLNLPGAVPVIRAVFSIGTIVIGTLVILGLWGAPTSPLLLLISAVSLLILLALRDAGPDYVAALQLAIWERIKVGESIRLQDGEQGVVASMGWHNVEIITAEGHTLIIPNSRLTRQIVMKFKESPEAVKESLEFFEKQTSAALCAAGQQTTCVDLADILSRRELEIAELVSHGATNKELAKTLFISENTAKVHIKNILRKLELKNRQQLAVLAAARVKQAK